jgi:hypothetical protein
MFLYVLYTLFCLSRNENKGNTTDVTEEQDYENNAAEADEDTSKQYTELTHYSNDTVTYEPLRV